MNKINFTIDESAVSELLGRQNFSNERSAVLEIIKNSFDAGATNIWIKFEKKNNKMIIIFDDNGDGMNNDELLNRWMLVGKSYKEYKINTIGGMRVQSGSKGIGRFALARLGKYIYVLTKKVGYDGISWQTDWVNTYYQMFTKIDSHGTNIRIEGLNDQWNKKNYDLLIDYIKRVYNSTQMTITMQFLDEEPLVIEPIFCEPKIGRNFVTSVDFKYDSIKKSISININSDEFSDEMIKVASPINIHNYQKDIKVEQHLYKKYKNDYSVENFDTFLKGLGDFSGNYYFGLSSSTKIEQEKFSYKYRDLNNRYDYGIVLYRNAFSITNFEGYKDWLSLNARGRKSPAAATHPTGAWRVRSNQISGKIHIDKEINKNIQDMSNRQGLNEDDFFHLFVDINHLVISEFEYYRQSIIRKTVKNDLEKENENESFNKVIKNPNILKNMSNDELKQFVYQYKSIKTELISNDEKHKEMEDRYRYDMRILNVLATLGLRASTVAHELYNDKNMLQDSFNNIKKALNEFGYWDDIISKHSNELAHKNIPTLIMNGDMKMSRVISFINIMLEQIEKKSFVKNNISLFDCINDIKAKWEQDYSWINIFIPQITVESSSKLVSKDIVTVIFDNLILNSVQQNDTLATLNISISHVIMDEEILFKYSDNGIGLNEYYRQNPYRILEVHETSRTNGHGLGMWIVSNTIFMTGGKVIDIPINKGFSFEFTLGDAIYNG